MKKLGMWGTALSLVLVASVALAQVYYQNRGTTLQSAVAATGNGASLDVTAGSVVVYQVSGTYTGTVTFEGSLDGTNWNSLNCQAGISSTVVSSTTTTGFFFCPTNGVVLARGRVTWTSGTSVTVNASASSAPALSMLTSISGLTSPSITTGLNDTNGNQEIGFTASTTAVNNITVSNAPTGNNPFISVTGTDGKIGIMEQVKASGTFQYKAGAGVAGFGVHMEANQSSQPVLGGGQGGGAAITALSTDSWGSLTASNLGASALVLFTQTWTNTPVCVGGNNLRASGQSLTVTTTAVSFSSQGYVSGDVLTWACFGRF